MAEPEASPLTAYNLIYANLVLTALKAGIIFPTQPLQVIMRHQQAILRSETPRTLTAFNAAREIRTQGGYLSFFKGGTAGMGKEVAKNATYKGALINGAPELASKILPNSLDTLSPTTYRISQAVVAGQIAAISDVVFGGIPEAYATFRATSQGAYSNASFFDGLMQERGVLAKVASMYRGFLPALAKGSVAFTTFFGAQYPIKRAACRLFGIEHDMDKPWYVTALTAVGTGAAVAATSSPFDIVKTQAQMPGGDIHTQLWRALQQNYRVHGINGIAAGLPIKAAMITIGWGMSFLAMHSITPEETPSKSSRPS